MDPLSSLGHLGKTSTSPRGSTLELKLDTQCLQSGSDAQCPGALTFNSESLFHTRQGLKQMRDITHMPCTCTARSRASLVYIPLACLSLKARLHIYADLVKSIIVTGIPLTIQVCLSWRPSPVTDLVGSCCIWISRIRISLASCC